VCVITYLRALLCRRHPGPQRVPNAAWHLAHPAADLHEHSRGGVPAAHSEGALIFYFFFISHIKQLTPQQQSAEPRNSAGAEALAVAKRPTEASREKTRKVNP